MNSVYITGNVGKDPSFKTTPNGFTFINFNLGVNESYKDKEGSWQTKTNWINCKVMGHLAKKHEGVIKKGLPLFVYGRLESGSYDKEGRKIYYTNVIVEKIGIFKKPEKKEDNDPYLEKF